MASDQNFEGFFFLVEGGFGLWGFVVLVAVWFYLFLFFAWLDFFCEIVIIIRNRIGWSLLETGEENLHVFQH